MTVLNQINLISVIVPAFKCERFIEKCIISILTQTYTNLELILVVDGCYDKTPEICNSYAARDSRVKVIVKENEGTSVARNCGLKDIRGGYVAFVDADDYLEKDYLSTLVKHAIANNADITFCDFYVDDASCTIEDEFFLCDMEQIDATDMINCCIDPGRSTYANKNSSTNVGVPWGKLYKSDLLTQHRLEFVPGLKRMQDTIFNLYAFSYAHTFCYVKQPLYHYVKNDSSVTVRYTEDFDKTAETLIAALYKYNAWSGGRLKEECINEKIMGLFLEVLRLQYMHPDCPLSHRQKITELKRIYYYSAYDNVVNNSNLQLLSRRKRMIACALKTGRIGMVYRGYYLYRMIKNRKD